MLKLKFPNYFKWQSRSSLERSPTEMVGGQLLLNSYRREFGERTQPAPSATKATCRCPQPDHVQGQGPSTKAPGSPPMLLWPLASPCIRDRKLGSGSWAAIPGALCETVWGRCTVVLDSAGEQPTLHGAHLPITRLFGRCKQQPGLCPWSTVNEELTFPWQQRDWVLPRNDPDSKQPEQQHKPQLLQRWADCNIQYD